jgi:hypothetical protein
MRPDPTSLRCLPVAALATPRFDPPACAVRTNPDSTGGTPGTQGTQGRVFENHGT